MRREGAPEEHNGWTQEQIVCCGVISTMDEGRPREHPHAALHVRRERHAGGALQRGLADHAGVRRSGAGFEPWSVLLDRGEPWDSCQDTPHVVVLCFFCPMTHHRSTGMLKELEWEDSQKSRAEEHAPTTTLSS